MGRRRRNHVAKLRRLKLEQEKQSLQSNEEPVKVSTSDLNNKPMVEPTVETKIDLKAENEAPVEIKKTEAPKKTTRRKTTKKPTTISAKKKTNTTTTKTKTTTPKRRRSTRTTKKVEETKNEQS
jgi:hypothetical protein